MANIDVAELAKDMLQAAQGKLQPHWKAAKSFAALEMRKLAETAAEIELGRLDGTISKQQAEILLAMQANASQAVLTSIETVGMIAAQDAINAALNVLKTAVNKAIGIAFL